MFTTTSFHIFCLEQRTRRLVTLCSKLDSQLGGGIEQGKITEFCGGPGSGKTQICLQLSLTVQFPTDCGGIDGKAIFIDTNQDFAPERLSELAEHMSEKFRKLTQNKASTTNGYDLDNLLKNISYIYCKNFKELLAHLLLLHNTLKTDPKIKLVVIDSFSNIIRNVAYGVSERIRILFRLLTELQVIAHEFQIAIVITNELTTHLSKKCWKIRPALGSVHLHKINNRIILSKTSQNNVRCALVAKSSVSEKINIPIQIKAHGMRCLQK